jgi:hypothetical protein
MTAMTIHASNHRALASLLAVALAGMSLTGCGDSSSGAQAKSAGGGSQINGSTPTGYTTITEKIGSHHFSVAVPHGWTSSAVNNTGGGYFTALITANGASITNTTALSANTGGVLLLWSAKTATTATRQIHTQAAVSTSAQHVLSHSITRVHVSGATGAELLSERFDNNAGAAAEQRILAAITDSGGLVDVEAYASTGDGSTFNPAATVDSLSIH